MAATLIEPTQPIEVKQLCCLIYGQPGSRKTSMAQTCDAPITLAFDQGIYRAFGRKRAAIFDTWEDVVGFDTLGHRTVVVDTVGACLGLLGRAIVADNPKNGNRLGGLSLQGYGILKERFRGWVESCKGRGQDLVFIAQEKAEKNGEDTYYCPDIVGGSYNILMENCDLVGYMHFEAGKRVLDFNPTDRWMAKAPPCGWSQFQLPDFGQQPDFLAKLLAEAKASMGRVSAASAEAAAVIEAWRAKLAADPNLDEFNAMLPEAAALANGLRRQIGALLGQHATACGWKYDKAAGVYVRTEAA